MADIPNQTVARRIEDIMKRNREFDDPQTSAKMATRHGHRIDQFGA